MTLPLGRILATPGALAALTRALSKPDDVLHRHVSGDWGDLDHDDRAANDRAADGGGRVLSAYILSTGEKIWVITEGDRSSTTILLPEEY